MVRFVPLVVLLCWAAIEDVRSRRIRNWISYTLILSGLAIPFLPQAPISIGEALGGFVVGFGVCFVLYALRALGAADVKLLAGVGAWLGVKPVLAVFALAAIAGMVIALMMATRQGRLRGLLRDGLILGAGLAQGSPTGISGFSDGGLARFDLPESQIDPSLSDERRDTSYSAPASVAGNARRRSRGLPFAVAITFGTVAVLGSSVVLNALHGR